MASFRILGIPVQIDPWFLLGLFFVFSWSGGNQVGLFAAVAIGVLTLIHELGHALTARRFGCQVSIRLNLFVGWASYSSVQPLKRRQQVLISLAGPLTQLAAAGVAMTIVHQIFQGRRGDPITLFNLWQGLSWAGVVIALLNLLPLWPLDGGHVVHHLLGRFLDPRAALRAMLFVTLAGLALLVAFSVLSNGGSGALADARYNGPIDAARAILDPSITSALWQQVASFPAHLLNLPWFLVLFSGLATLQAFQQLSGPKRSEAAPDPASVADALAAESRGWAEGRIGEFPTGWSPSPWLHAHVARQRGDERGVDAALAQVVAGGRRWVLPDPGNRSLAPLAARIGGDPPLGELLPSLVVLQVLSHHAPAEQLLAYANRVYSTHGSVEALVVAAAGLVRQHHPDDAMRWLERAMREAPDRARLTTDPAFLPLQHRPDFERLVAEVSGRL